jgi:hypothetical protein
MTQQVPPNFVGLGDQISPTYLNGPVFQAYRFAMAVMYDDAIDLTAMALRAAIPALAPADALPWIAQDRQIFQGPSETVAGYTSRLIQWLDLWRLAGNSTSVLLAYLSWLTPLTPQVSTVQTSSGTSPITVWRTYEVGEVPFPPGQTIPTQPDILTQTTENWDWDGSDPPYYFPWCHWRAWIIIQSNGAQAPWVAPTATWSPASGTVTTNVISDPVLGTVYSGSGGSGSNATEFNWDASTCWDWTGTAQQAASLVALAKTWKSAGTWVPWIIVSYNASYFQPTNAKGADSPDGTWGFWGKVVTDATLGSVYTAARPASSIATFIAGTQDGGQGLPLGAC